MSEQEPRRDEAGQGEDREVKSAAPSDESKVVGDGADVPAGEGEEADEAEAQGSSRTSGETDDDGAGDGTKEERGDGAEDGTEDDRDELAREIESDPASNPADPMLKEIKGG